MPLKYACISNLSHTETDFFYGGSWKYKHIISLACFFLLPRAFPLKCIVLEGAWRLRGRCVENTTHKTALEIKKKLYNLEEGHQGL